MASKKRTRTTAANVRTNIVGFRGFDSSMILILRGGIPMSIGDFPESLSRAILVGTMLVGRLGVTQLLQESKRPGGWRARDLSPSGR